MSTIDFNLPCPNDPFDFPAVSQNVDILPALEITAANAGGTVTMVINSIEYDSGGFVLPHCSGTCGSSQTLFGVTIETIGDTVTISGTPDTANVTIIITVTAESNTNCSRIFNLPIARAPIDLGLVLDRSGSMNSALGTGTRWDGLETGVGALASQLMIHEMLDDDMLGMRLFASNVITPGAPFNGGLVSLESNVGDLESVLSSVSPSGNTALGDGIVAVRDMLLPGTSGNRKSMIVFSDGVQNVGDQVKTTVPNMHTHTNGGEKLSGPANEIEIYTVCLGMGGANEPLMTGIASANGGESMVTSTGEESDFETFFTAQLPNILGESTPQVVELIRDAFPAGSESREITHTFAVNGGTTSVAVTVFAATRHEVHFTSISKDGTELIGSAQQIFGPGFVSIGVRYPVEGQPGFRLDGQWSVTIRRGTAPREPIPYTLMALADSHLVHPSYSAGAAQPKVGDSLDLSVTLRRAGQPVENADVEAIIVRPGDDLNHLLALADVDVSIDPDDPNTPAGAKLDVLRKDPEFLAKMATQDQLISLTFNAAQGAYLGTYNQLDLSGVYQVLYRISADDPEVGTIQRRHQQSVYVRFPDVDLGNSELTVVPGEGNITIIRFRPRASNGKYIGPGWASAIAFEATGATVNNITDHGDGRYSIAVSGPLSGPGKIVLYDETVFDGDLSDLKCFGGGGGLLERIQCWLMKLGLPRWVIWLFLLILLIIILILI